MNRVTLAALITVPLVLLGGCAVAAVGVTAIVVTEEWRDQALTADVQEDVEIVWASTKRSMSNMTDALLHVDEDLRAIETRVDNAVVRVHVANWTVGETRIWVEAKKYMLNSNEVAQLVQSRIVKDLSR